MKREIKKEKIEDYQKQLLRFEPVLKELIKRIEILTEEKNHLEDKIKNIKRKIKVKKLFIS